MAVTLRGGRVLLLNHSWTQDATRKHNSLERMAVVAGGGGEPYSAIALHALIGEARDAPDICALLEALGP
jgi:hypothetical protein